MGGCSKDKDRRAAHSQLTKIAGSARSIGLRSRLTSRHNASNVPYRLKRSARRPLEEKT